MCVGFKIHRFLIILNMSISCSSWFIFVFCLRVIVILVCLVLCMSFCFRSSFYLLPFVHISSFSLSANMCFCLCKSVFTPTSYCLRGKSFSRFICLLFFYSFGPSHRLCKSHSLHLSPFACPSVRFLSPYFFSFCLQLLFLSPFPFRSLCLAVFFFRLSLINCFLCLYLCLCIFLSVWLSFSMALFALFLILTSP